ncbi:ubiquitin-like protein [Vairimorpha necatrix]|uniref:Ubiquitin-like protein n=1 Tax=Vairimorpha necatrix TaxID=6039 RepID=A0AAX4JGG5_9MICR
MIINLKVLCNGSFYIKVDDSITVKELHEMISEKIKTKKFYLRKENKKLLDMLDLNTYEFTQNDCVELVYIK